MMQMKRLFSCAAIFAFFTCFPASAQDIIKSLQQNVAGHGVVVIHQDPVITALIGSQSERIKSGRTMTLSGYRIQAYAGNNTRKAKNEAHQMASRIKTLFPDMPVYTTFLPPRWICRTGDFRTIEEADAVMRKMREKGSFKEVSIVKDQINIYY